MKPVSSSSRHAAKSPRHLEGRNLAEIVAIPDTLGRRICVLTLLGIAITLSVILFGPQASAYL